MVLEQFDQIEPERIESYLAVGGYRALLDCIHHRSPAAIIAEITKSGLRGRGGGYPTGLKWSTVAQAPSSQEASNYDHSGHSGSSTGYNSEHYAHPPPRGTQNPRKYVICNADEGDPRAFMDRNVLESAPHPGSWRG